MGGSFRKPAGRRPHMVGGKGMISLIGVLVAILPS